MQFHSDKYPMMGHAFVEEFETLLGEALRPRKRFDVAAWLLHSPFVDANRGTFRLRYIDAWCQWAFNEATRIGAGPEQVLSGEAGWQKLETLHATIVERLATIAGRRSPLSWLMVSKRIHPANLLPTLRPSLAENVLNGMWSAVPPSLKQNRLSELFMSRFWMSPKVLTDLDELLSGGLILSNVRSAQKRVAKGQSLRLSSSALHAEVVDIGDDIERSIYLFDARMALVGGRGDLQGGIPRVATDAASVDLITWIDLRDQDFLPQQRLKDLLAIYGPIFPIGTSLAELAPAVFQSGTGITLETQAAAAALQIGWAYLVERNAISRNDAGDWSQFGYLRCSKAWLHGQLAAGPTPSGILGSTWVDGATVDNVAELLENLLVLFTVGPWSIIDLTAATALLGNSFRRIQEGAAANFWGESFEVEVQRVIDRSAWRPPDYLRPLIKKKVKDRDGNVITDIDCVAFRQGAVMLIDCKSFQAQQEFHDGAYDAVQRVKRKATEASDAWIERVKKIQMDPALLGINIPADVSIEGLVIMPYIPYVPHDSTAARPVGELLHVSGVYELLRALALANERNH